MVKARLSRGTWSILVTRAKKNKSRKLKRKLCQSILKQCQEKFGKAANCKAFCAKAQAQ